MSDPASAAPASAAAPAPVPEPAWKPEPRRYAWADLFTAPMLAFKPKCMALSAATLVVTGLWLALFYEPLISRTPLADSLRQDDLQLWFEVVRWAWWAVALVLFSIGATVVSTVLKADLLDDEFLSWREIAEQAKGRILPAVLVPLALYGLGSAVWGGLWLLALAASIPYAGALGYGLLYPLVFLAGLFAVLVSIAVLLSVFVAPAIVAVRRHGWFDNVVDTVEVVGTKPHLLVAGAALSALMVLVAHGIAVAALAAPGAIARTLPFAKQGNQVVASEAVADVRQREWLKYVVPERFAAQARRAIDPGVHVSLDADSSWHEVELRDLDRQPFFVLWISGLGVSLWQALIALLILGYVVNLILSGGLITYLWVREDDYWDEEDLEDLDQLAKELEEEARQATVSTPPVPAPAG